MATNDFTPFAVGGSANVITQAAYVALTSLTQNGFQTGIAQSNQLNKVWRQSSIMSAVLGQFIVNTTGQNATDDGTTATLLTNLINAISANSEATIGAVRNLAMSVTAASASATLTADEIVVGSALGGLKYTLASFSKTINLATTGAGGMDTGSAPVSGFVALYAIYNPTTQTAALLATNATSAVAPNVYGGANMPSGYTASGLVSVWPTNGSSLLIVGYQQDRQITLANTFALNSASTSTGGAITSLNLSTIVPKNAKTVIGSLTMGSNASSNLQITVYANSAGIGTQGFVFLGSPANFYPSSGYTEVLTTAQTLYYASNSTAGTPTFSISVAGYTF